MNLDRLQALAEAKLRPVAEPGEFGWVVQDREQIRYYIRWNLPGRFGFPKVATPKWTARNSPRNQIRRRHAHIFHDEDDAIEEAEGIREHEKHWRADRVKVVSAPRPD